MPSNKLVPADPITGARYYIYRECALVHTTERPDWYSIIQRDNTQPATVPREGLIFTKPSLEPGALRPATEDDFNRFRVTIPENNFQRLVNMWRAGDFESLFALVDCIQRGPGPNDWAGALADMIEFAFRAARDPDERDLLIEKEIARLTHKEPAHG